MCLLGHPFYFINLLKHERMFYDDGLFQRFLFVAPMPPYITAEQMRATPPSKMAMHSLFYFIYVTHFEKKRNYTFSIEAQKIIDYQFNLCRERVRMVNEFDSFIGALIGKSLTHLVRIAMAFKAMEVAAETIKDCPDVAAFDLTVEFAKKANELSLKLPSTAFIIDEPTVTRAVNLVEYFNLNKLILCSYQVDPDGTFTEAFEKICEQKPSHHILSTRFATVPPKILRFMRKVFSIEQEKINATILANGNLNVTECNIVFSNLEQLGLGTQIVETANNSHRVNWFLRIKANQIMADESLGQILIDMGLTLKTVIKTLEDTELKVQMSESFTLRGQRRPRNDSNDGNNKTKKRLQRQTSCSSAASSSEDFGLDRIFESNEKDQNQVVIHEDESQLRTQNTTSTTPQHTNQIQPSLDIAQNKNSSNSRKKLQNGPGINPSSSSPSIRFSDDNSSSNFSESEPTFNSTSIQSNSSKTVSFTRRQQSFVNISRGLEYDSDSDSMPSSQTNKQPTSSVPVNVTPNQVNNEPQSANSSAEAAPYGYTLHGKIRQKPGPKPRPNQSSQTNNHQASNQLAPSQSHPMSRRSSHNSDIEEPSMSQNQNESKRTKDSRVTRSLPLKNQTNNSQHYF